MHVAVPRDEAIYLASYAYIRVVIATKEKSECLPVAVGPNSTSAAMPCVRVCLANAGFFGVCMHPNRSARRPKPNAVMRENPPAIDPPPTKKSKILEDRAKAKQE